MKAKVSTVRKITLKDGYEVTVDIALFDDADTFELIARAANGEILVMPLLSKKILSPEEHEGLKEHLRGEDGIVKASTFFEALTEIFEKLNGEKEVKN